MVCTKSVTGLNDSERLLRRTVTRGFVPPGERKSITLARELSLRGRENEHARPRLPNADPPTFPRNFRSPIIVNKGRRDFSCSVGRPEEMKGETVTHKRV